MIVWNAWCVVWGIVGALIVLAMLLALIVAIGGAIWDAAIHAIALEKYKIERAYAATLEGKPHE